MFDKGSETDISVNLLNSKHSVYVFHGSKSNAGLEAEIDDDEPAEGIELGTAHPWEGSDRDYKYEEVGLWAQFTMRMIFDLLEQYFGLEYSPPTLLASQTTEISASRVVY